MHIPDGYLSPATCATFYAGMVPIWYAATRRVKTIVKSQYVPLIAVGAAFSFLVMMFNIPVPDGTTAHAVGAVMIAIVLGPWAAVIAVSIALGIQALFFGDGGVLALSANAFNMAFVMPWVGYALYRVLARGLPLTSSKRAIAAGIGGYVGIVASSLAAAIEFGVQPTLFHTANGTPLYAPFHLSQTIPAMLLAHLTVAGIAEFVVTFGVVTYLRRANVPILRINHPTVPVTEAEMARSARLGWRQALVFFGIMMALTPLGLLAPGGAFGEDVPANLDLAKYHLGAVPDGLNRLSSFWSHTFLGGYGFGNGEHPVLGYLLSAATGFAIVTLVMAAFVVVYRKVTGGRDESAGPAEADVREIVRGGTRVRAVQPAGTTPAWLIEGEAELCPTEPSGVRKRRSFVEKTLSGASNVMRQAMFGEDIAAEAGFLQGIDPRVKIVAFVVLLLTTALVRAIPVLIGIYACTLVLSVTSKLPLGFFVKRVWLFIPIFTGIVVIPAMFSFITPGHIVLPLWSWGEQQVGITSQGLAGAGLLVMRVACSVSLVVLLTLTTSWTRLLAGLRALFVPKIFILIIGMAYRYIFLLLNSVTDMFTARKARAVGNERADMRAGQRFVAATAGTMFGKAHALSEEVHMAMVSRGYSGEAKTLQAPAIGATDVVFAVSVLAFSVLVLAGEHILGL